jgi:long-chain acyl-CoA synthetase
MLSSVTPSDASFVRIQDVPAYWASRSPDAVALLDDQVELSYAALKSHIETVSAMLSECGVKPGHRVMLVAENSIALVTFIFAVTAVGACAVIVNARLSPGEIEGIQQHCDPQLVVFLPAGFDAAVKHAEHVGASLSALPDLGVFHLWRAPEQASRDAGLTDVAALIYTSGTTGAPKGVMLSHSNLLFIATTMARYRDLTPQDRSYAVLPMSHTMGLTSVMLSTLLAGGSVQVVARFEVAHLVDALEKSRITLFQGVQAMYTGLLGFLKTNGRSGLQHHLRYIYAGGSPLDPTLKASVEALFDLSLNNGYGMTESSPTICHTRLDERRGDSSVGPPIPGIKIRIVDTGGRDVPQGESGELWVSGPNVMQGYFRNAEASSEVLQDGWLKSGDLASVDADGNVHLVGRLKDVIIRSGFNVYPVEVETALNAHPAVERSAVVGRNVTLNEEVVAFVELRANAQATPAELLDWLKPRLSPYKRPGEIIFMSSLPSLPSGKIRKADLKDLAQKAPRP